MKQRLKGHADLPYKTLWL